MLTHRQRLFALAIDLGIANLDDIGLEITQVAEYGNNEKVVALIDLLECFNEKKASPVANGAEAYAKRGMGYYQYG